MKGMEGNQIWGRIGKVLSYFCLSMGVLAIANLETLWHNQSQMDLPENEVINSNMKARDKARIRPKVKLEWASNNPHFKPLQSSLSQSLEQDELKDQNPFAHLSTMEPLHQIMLKGVTKFKREVYRSPQYQDESGYDMLAYDIEHNDKSRSSLLAYLEKPDESAWRNVGAPDQRLIFVVFMVSNGERTTYSFFRGGDLIEQSDLTMAEAQTLIAHRLSTGVPFLSVSR
jgi:hypothetical protein